MDPEAVQECGRRAFSRWGRPSRWRVDNGYPWGSNGDLPTDLALWLIGLGVDVTWNRPRTPQDNGMVERGQGIGQNWAEPQTCSSALELQQRFERFDRIQREDYPVEGGRSRLELYPELRHSGREYSRAWEKQHWDFQRVLEHLTDYAAERQVSHKGMVSVYDRSYYVGTAYRGQRIFIRVDPVRVEWVAVAADDRQLRRWPADQLTRATICGLLFSRRRRGTAGRAPIT